MKIYLHNGKLYAQSGDLTVSDIRVSLEYWGKTENYVDIFNDAWTIDEKNVSVSASMGEGGRFRLFFEKSEYGIVVSADFLAGEQQRIEQSLRFKIWGRLQDKPSVAVYNKTDNWINGNRCIYHMGANGITTALVKDQTVCGADYVAYKCGVADKYGVLGCVTFNEFFNTVSLSENGNFCFIANLNEHLYDFTTFCVTPSRYICTDKFLIAASENDVLPLYGKMIAQTNGVRKKFDTPIGWCSWYYYGSGISERVVLENLEIIKKENLPIQYIQIDEGWEECFGDWEANEKFPAGMKSLADKIKEAGYTPGLWVAPFQFSDKSKIVKEHPEWFIYDADYVTGKRFFIDYNKSEPKRFLYDLFKKISVDWGFRYIKMDLVIDAMALGGYTDPNCNMVKSFRAILPIIRSAVTEDTMILACTCPMGQSVGMDALRIGMDIFESWNALKNVATQVLKRLYIREYAIVDPDCIMLRTSAKEDDECFRFCTRTEQEIKTFITFLSVCGGTIMYSDKLSLLKENDFKLMKSLYPLNKNAAEAVDLYERDIPSVFYYGERNGFEMYALMNWQDFEDIFTITLLEEKYGKEYFTKEEFSQGKSFEIRLQPHESKILYFSKEREEFERLTDSIMPTE